MTTDPATAISGTKAYAGITGSLTVTISYAATLPFKNGKCNMNANPSAAIGQVNGTGTVSTDNCEITCLFVDTIPEQARPYLPTGPRTE